MSESKICVTSVFGSVKSRNGEEGKSLLGLGGKRERPGQSREKSSFVIHPKPVSHFLRYLRLYNTSLRVKMMRSALQTSRVASRAAPRSIGATRFFGAKEIKFGVEGRAAMLRGVDLLADAVQVRLWKSRFLTLKFRFPSEYVMELGISKLDSSKIHNSPLFFMTVGFFLSHRRVPIAI
jgi:hypothetical protein